jgi:hypothetical protein
VTPVKYVPKGKRAIWHDKAMNASDQADLNFVIELWLATKEMNRLVRRLRRSTHQELESLSHYTTESAAKKLARPHPDVAAKVYRALGCAYSTRKRAGTTTLPCHTSNKPGVVIRRQERTWPGEHSSKRFYKPIAEIAPSCPASKN